MKLQKIPIIFLAIWAYALIPFSASALIHVVDCTGAAGAFTDIQPAIVAAGPGDSIVVYECAGGGAYTAFTVVGPGYDNLHIVGAHAAAAPPITGAPVIGVGVTPASFNPIIVVDGTSFPGNCATIDNTVGVKIAYLKFQNCMSNGIEVIASDTALIVGNRVQDVVGAGIIVKGNVGHRIIGNLVLRSGVDGIAIDSGGRNLVGDNMVFVSRNVGIFMANTAGSNNEIINNLVRFSFFDGILVRGTGTRVERNTSRNNLIVGGTADIWIDPAGGAPATVDVIGNNTGGGSLVGCLPLLPAECSDNT